MPTSRVQRARHRSRRAAVVAAGVVVLGAVVVGALWASRPSPKQIGAPPGSTSTTVGAPPLAATVLAPASGAHNVDPMQPIEIQFSAALPPDPPKPVLAPSVAGSWRETNPETLVFTPSVPFIPLTDVSVTIPAGTSGIVASNGGELAEPVVDTFEIRNGSTLRLQQLLALLDYSPLSFTPAQADPAPTDLAAQRAALFDAPAGSFAWRQPGWPTELSSLWHRGGDNVMTRGLVMSFQADHGLTPDGQPSAGLWNDLINALAGGDLNTGGYNFALANQRTPQTLTIWHDGAVVLHTGANLGIAQSPTKDGIFPVSPRFRREVMRGTNPDGSKYADPVQFVAYFNGGDAVHYLPRANYGIPQSLGCVELPLPQSAKAWPYLAYGTLVMVVN